MRHRCNIYDLSNFDTAVMDCSDCRFSTCTRTLNINLHFLKASFNSYLRTIFCCHLRCIRSVLLGSSKAHFTGARPRDHLTLIVGKRDDDVVKSCRDACSTNWFNFNFSLFCCFSGFFLGIGIPSSTLFDLTS